MYCSVLGRIAESKILSSRWWTSIVPAASGRPCSGVNTGGELGLSLPKQPASAGKFDGEVVDVVVLSSSLDCSPEGATAAGDGGC